MCTVFQLCSNHNHTVTLVSESRRCSREAVILEKITTSFENSRFFLFHLFRYFRYASNRKRSAHLILHPISEASLRLLQRTSCTTLSICEEDGHSPSSDHSRSSSYYFPFLCCVIPSTFLFQFLHNSTRKSSTVTKLQSEPCCSEEQSGNERHVSSTSLL